MIEVHHEPDKALSDGPQSLYPLQFGQLMRDLYVIAPVVGKQLDFGYLDKARAMALRSRRANGTRQRAAFMGRVGTFSHKACLSRMQGVQDCWHYRAEDYESVHGCRNMPIFTWTSAAPACGKAIPRLPSGTWTGLRLWGMPCPDRSSTPGPASQRPIRTSRRQLHFSKRPLTAISTATSSKTGNVFRTGKAAGGR